MFQIKLNGGKLTVGYSKSRTVSANNNCINCIYTPNSSDLGLFRASNHRENPLKKNFKLITLNNGNYIIYNEKNQALIDRTIFNTLTHLNPKDIESQELLTILYELKFIINE